MKNVLYIRRTLNIDITTILLDIVSAITVCKVIEKLITKIVFWYQTNIKKEPKRSAWYEQSFPVINFK